MIIFGLLLQLILLLKIQFTVWPEFIVYPYLVNNGLKPYRDIVDQHLPGFILTPINFANLSIDSPDEFKTLFITISLAQSILLYKFSKNFLKNGLEKYVAVFHGVIQPIFTTGKIWYESFVTLFLSLSLFLLGSNNYLLSGISAGLMTLWKQTGVFLAIPIFIYLIINKRTSGVKFAIGFLLPIIIWTLYLAANNLVGDFINWTIKFNFFYPSIAHLSVPISVIALLTFITVPLLANSVKELNFKLIVFTSLYLFSFIGVFVRFDYFHLQIITPGLVIMIAMFLKQQSTFIRMSYTILLLLFIARLSSSLPITSTQAPFYDTQTLNISSWIKNNTNSNEEVFLLGAQPHIYKLSNTIPPGKYFVYLLPWYLKYQESKQLEVLQSKKPKYIVVDSTAIVDGHSITEYGKRLFTYTMNNYIAVKYIENYTVYEKSH